tara:strand:+ start:309 stop:458 length:150 start_codon:yes stop_codon:yes gene_type:complete
MNKETGIEKSVRSVLEDMLPRIYISRLKRGDREAIYSEFREWIESGDLN